MSKLEELIADLCPDGVEYVSFGDICSIITKQTGFDYTNHIKDSLIREKITDCLPYIQTKFFAGKIFDFKTDYYVPYHIVEKFPKITLDSRCILLSIVGASIGNIGLFPGDRKCFLGGAICVAKPHESYNVDYLFYYLTSRDGQKQIFNKVKGAGQATVTIEDIRKFKVPIPPLPVQSEIVRILDNFKELAAELTEKLTAELTARKQQYEYYRDKLLNFGDEVEWKKLDGVSNIVDSLHKTPRYVESGYSMIRVTDIKGGYLNDENTLKVDKETFEVFTKNYVPQNNDIVMSRVGSYGNSSIVRTNGKICLGQNTVVIHPLINNKYLYYILVSQNVKQYIEKNVSGGSQKTLSLKSIKEIPIPILPIEEQKRIVAILDRFDAMCNHLTSSLPAEIEMRKKQYEYYRDKLLTFKEIEK